MLGTQEIAIILLIVIVLFVGTNKLPEFMRNIGRASGEIKKGKKEIEKEIEDMNK